MTLSLNAVGALALESVTDPRSAARKLMGLNFSSSVLWSGLALAVLCNAIIFSLANIISPPEVPVPGFVGSPFIFALFLFAGLVVTVYGLHWGGRMFGGQGDLGDMFVLMTWMQVLRVMVQLAMLVVVPLAPGLAGVLVLAVSVVGFWILVNFVDTAHGFSNLFKSLGVILFAIIGIAFGMSLILSIIGVSTDGVPNVGL